MAEEKWNGVDGILQDQILRRYGEESLWVVQLGTGDAESVAYGGEAVDDVLVPECPEVDLLQLFD